MPASNGFRIHTKGGRSNFHKVNYIFVYPDIITKNNVRDSQMGGGGRIIYIVQIPKERFYESYNNWFTYLICFTKVLLLLLCGYLIDISYY